MRHLVVLAILVHATPAPADPVCVAHRGNSGEHLENSCEALESALDLGAKAVEFDVRHTQDGVGVIMHDATLARTARSHGSSRCPLSTPIGELSEAEVSEKCRLRNGERIPVLEEFLETIHGAGVVVFLELKDSPSAETIALIETFFNDSPHELRLISFSASVLESARSQLAPLIERGARAYHITSDPERLNFGFDGICVRKPSRSVVRSVMDREQDLGVWTIDDVRRMQDYADLGVDFIVTNRIASCLDAL
jgi:glycerophosphoryl diester phosphodiesterase